MRVIAISLVLSAVLLWIFISTDYGKSIGEAILDKLNSIFGMNSDSLSDEKEEKILDDPCVKCEYVLTCQKDCDLYIEFQNQEKEV